MRDFILIVDDDERLSEQLSTSALSLGLLPKRTRSGLEAVRLVQRHLPSLILLDWSIDGISGIEVCRRLRSDLATKFVPIIMISGRGDEDDRIHGLSSGADDYLVKPFSVAELFARVRALLRRRRPSRDTVRLTVGDIALDAAEMRVTRCGEELRLRTREFELLHFLMTRSEEVVSAERLRFHVWRDEDVALAAVTQAVSRLRRSLRLDGLPDPIRTVRAEGYALEA